MVLYRKKRYKCPQNSIQTNSYFDTKKNHEPIEITRKFKYLNYIYSVSIGGPGDPDPQSGAAAPDPRESPKESRVPLRVVKGRGGSIFCPMGKKSPPLGPMGPPLDYPTQGGPLAPPTSQPLPGAGPPSAPVYHPGPGSVLLPGGTTGADWPAPYGSPTRPAGPGGSPSLSPCHPLSQPARCGGDGGPGSGEGSRRRRNGPRRAVVAPGGRIRGRGPGCQGRAPEGPRVEILGRPPQGPKYYPALDFLGRCRRLWQGVGHGRSL